MTGCTRVLGLGWGSVPSPGGEAMLGPYLAGGCAQGGLWGGDFSP